MKLASITLLLLLCAFVIQAQKPGGPSLPLQLAFTHPDAVAQPTSMGKVIRVLYDYEGKLYSGYGDWDTNTGPIKICAFDPNVGTLLCEKDASTTDDFLMRNEQIAVYVTVNGRLYAPGIDPGGGGNHEFAQRTIDGTWFGANSPFSLIHVFDIATLNNQELWLFGSGPGDRAVAYHSPDGGISWDAPDSAANLDLLPTSTSNGFNRLYFGGAYQGKLYTQSPYYTSCRIYDPTTGVWSIGPNLFQVGPKLYQGYGSQAMEFASKLAYSTGYTGAPGFLFFFDGTTVSDGFKSARGVRSLISMQIVDSYLYALAWTTNGPAIIRTLDLVSWDKGGYVILSSENPTSMRILNSTIYIGTSNSNVYSTPMPTFSPLK